MLSIRQLNFVKSSVVFRSVNSVKTDWFWIGENAPISENAHTRKSLKRFKIFKAKFTERKVSEKSLILAYKAKAKTRQLWTIDLRECFKYNSDVKPWLSFRALFSFSSSLMKLFVRRMHVLILPEVLRNKLTIDRLNWALTCLPTKP